MMIGHITLSSKLLRWQDISMVLSLPRTWKATISMLSGIEGLIFPGMIDEPGCTSGRTISASPAFGPMFIILRSMQMLSRLTARDLRAAE